MIDLQLQLVAVFHALIAGKRCTALYSWIPVLSADDAEYSQANAMQA
jgi:hypothetical protein